MTDNAQPSIVPAGLSFHVPGGPQVIRMVKEPARSGGEQDHEVGCMWAEPRRSLRSLNSRH